jgi:thiamine-phosphate pyrophosphorylase
MRLVLPRVYVILDAALLTLPLKKCAAEMVDAGVRLMQYRDKQASARQLFDTSRELSEYFRPFDVKFIVNDRADVAALAGASGVHVGQDDLGVEEARVVVGGEAIVGVSTHNAKQFEKALKTSADYIAVGPVFATGSKENPDPVVGLEFVARCRTLTDRPIVAIGGITLERAAAVIEAGADSVAVISDIWRASDPGKRASEYLEVLGRGQAHSVPRAAGN